MNKYTIIILTSAGSRKIVKNARSIAHAVDGLDKEYKVISVTLNFSLCKCCVNNQEDFPKVMCRKEPYGENIDSIFQVITSALLQGIYDR